MTVLYFFTSVEMLTKILRSRGLKVVALGSIWACYKSAKLFRSYWIQSKSSYVIEKAFWPFQSQLPPSYFLSSLPCTSLLVHAATSTYSTLCLPLATQPGQLEKGTRQASVITALLQLSCSSYTTISLGSFKKEYLHTHTQYTNIVHTYTHAQRKK